MLTIICVLNIIHHSIVEHFLGIIMRLYSFVNFYLSSIQQGIQTAHVVGELSRSAHVNLFHVWAAHFKTIIVLNGGNAKELAIISAFLRQYMTEFPVASFSEDDASLGGIMTATGIIIPDYLWEEVDYFRKNECMTQDPERTDREQTLIRFIAQFPLAR